VSVHRNHSTKGLDFELGGRRYKVPAGSEVEIPDHLDYCVPGRGLPLTPCAGKSETAVRGEVVPPPAPPAALRQPVTEADEVDDELASVVGEDAPEEISEEDQSGLEKTVADLERQGVTLPGGRGRRRKG